MTGVDVLPAALLAAYAESFNQQDFEQTAQLFAADGQLVPPFETAVVGREAIADYLRTEAAGMRLEFASSQVHAASDSAPGRGCQVQVQGKAHTTAFTVNVAWQFDLTPVGEIASVRIRLLASLRALAGLRPQTDQSLNTARIWSGGESERIKL